MWGHDCRVVGSYANGGPGFRRISCFELAKPQRLAARFRSNGRSSRGTVCGLALQIFSPFSSCRRSWRIVCSVGRPLAGRADHGGICFPGLHVSRVVVIIPRAGRSYRSDISIVCDLPYPIRLACTPLYFFGWTPHWVFSLAQQLNMADRRDSFGRQHLLALRGGTIRLRPRHQRDRDRHRDCGQNRLQRDDLRQQRRVAAHLARHHVGAGGGRHGRADRDDHEAGAGNSEP